MLLFGTCDLCGKSYLVTKKSNIRMGDYLACINCYPVDGEQAPQAFIIHMPSGRITAEGMIFSDGSCYVSWQDFKEKVSYDTLETLNKELPSTHRLDFI